jgi:hypothetical protein
MKEQSGDLEGSYRCTIEGRKYQYLASYNGSRSVDWHATIRCDDRYIWSSGSIPHNTAGGELLRDAVRAHVLSSICDASFVPG